MKNDNLLSESVNQEWVEAFEKIDDVGKRYVIEWLIHAGNVRLSAYLEGWQKGRERAVKEQSTREWPPKNALLALAGPDRVWVRNVIESDIEPLPHISDEIVMTPRRSLQLGWYVCCQDLGLGKPGRFVGYGATLFEALEVGIDNVRRYSTSAQIPPAALWPMRLR